MKELWKTTIKIFLSSSTSKMLEQVLNSDELLRRVPFDVTDPIYIRPDQTVTSIAFVPRKINGVLENGLSVYISRLTTFELSIVNPRKYRLYSIKAERVRQLDLDCIHNPLPENYAHALIVGNIKKSKSKQLSLAVSRVPFPT